jgi:hypothetical protein
MLAPGRRTRVNARTRKQPKRSAPEGCWAAPPAACCHRARATAGRGGCPAPLAPAPRRSRQPIGASAVPAGPALGAVLRARGCPTGATVEGPHRPTTSGAALWLYALRGIKRIQRSKCSGPTAHGLCSTRPAAWAPRRPCDSSGSPQQTADISVTATLPGFHKQQASTHSSHTRPPGAQGPSAPHPPTHL